MDNTAHTHEIPLTVRRADFEAIYFADGRNRLLGHPEVRTGFYLFLGSLSIPLAGFAAFCFAAQSLFFVWLGLACVALGAWQFLRAARVIIRWRKQIKTYLDTLEKCASFALLLSPRSFAVREGQEETPVAWTAVQEVNLQPDYISIKAEEETFLFPRASLSPADYETLERHVQQYANH